MTKSKTLDNLDNIYVYLGSYKASNEADIEHSLRDTRVFHGNNDEIDYKKYRNLEGACFDDVIVPSDKGDEFEDENIIIYPRTNLFGKYFIDCLFKAGIFFLHSSQKIELFPSIISPFT